MSSPREGKTLSSASATRIRILAAEKQLKQADIADAAGMQRTTFGRYWREERSMTIDDLETILNVLGTSYAEEAAEIRKLQRASE